MSFTVTGIMPVFGYTSPSKKSTSQETVPRLLILHRLIIQLWQTKCRRAPLKSL